jgi:hypothetical protein
MSHQIPVLGWGKVKLAMSSSQSPRPWCLPCGIGFDFSFLLWEQGQELQRVSYFCLCLLCFSALFSHLVFLPWFPLLFLSLEYSLSFLTMALLIHRIKESFYPTMLLYLSPILYHFELRGSYMLGRHSTLWVTPSAQLYYSQENI